MVYDRTMGCRTTTNAKAFASAVERSRRRGRLPERAVGNWIDLEEGDTIILHLGVELEGVPSHYALANGSPWAYEPTREFHPSELELRRLSRYGSHSPEVCEAHQAKMGAGIVMGRKLTVSAMESGRVRSGELFAGDGDASELQSAITALENMGYRRCEHVLGETMVVLFPAARVYVALTESTQTDSFIEKV